MKKNVFIFFVTCFVVLQASALTFDLPLDGSTVIGQTKKAKTITGDTLTSMARRYDMGIYELLEANPTFKIGETYGPDKSFTVPSQFILPDTVHGGIVVNLAELRMYFYVPGTKQVKTFPVGIGREGWETPLGATYIARKRMNPTWTPTEHILSARAQDGVTLDKVVPAGPQNPLGGYAMYLGVPTILMHGSNDPTGIGRRSSSGCIRMAPEAIESFFDLVPVNLLVTIVDEPIKLGWLGNDLYVEAHVPLQDDLLKDTTQLKERLHTLVDAVVAKRPANIDWDTANQAVEEQRGYPIKIGEGIGPMPTISVRDNPNAIVHVKQNVVHPRETVLSKMKAYMEKTKKHQKDEAK